MRRSNWALLALAAATVCGGETYGADVYWQGGTDLLNAANYYKPSTGAQNITPPSSTDFSFVGESGVTSVVTGQAYTIPRLRIGHNFTAGEPSGSAGSGTLNVTGGALTLVGTVETAGHTLGSNGALIIGYNNTGAVNISGGSITVGRYVTVGLDDAGDAVDNAAGATA